MAAPVEDRETVVFNARFCGKKKVNRENHHVEPVETKVNNAPVHTSKEFNIKKARYEVIRFGMTGFDKERQLNSKIAMAIKLGAKPPKKKCINYKTLMEQKRKEKEALKNEDKNHYNIQTLKLRKKSNKKKKIKKQPNSLV